MANTIVINETPKYSLSVTDGTELQLTLSGTIGPTGAAGPNTVTTATASNLTGFISANGTTVSGATAGSTSATPSTLVLRNASGGGLFQSTSIDDENDYGLAVTSDFADAVNITSSNGTGVKVNSTTGNHLNIGSGKVIVANSGNTTLTGTIAASNLTGTNTGDQFTSVTSQRLIGRHAGGSGAAQEVQVGTGIEFSGSTIQRSALTGDVTATAGSNSTTIANDSVTNAKLANVATATIKGRTTAGTGDPEDLTLGTGIEFSGSTIRRSALTGDVTASAGSNATTLASTIAGAKTLSGQLELTGQASTNSTSAMTKSLTLDLEHLQQQLKIPFTGWAKTNTGSGSTGETPGALRLYTGVTTLSTSLARANSSSLLMMNKPGTNVTYNEIPWGSRVRVSFKTLLTGVDANTIARYQFGESFSKTTVSDLDQKGFGIKIENLSVKCLAHNGTILTTSAALFTATQNRMFTVLLDSDGAGNVNLYINGTSVGTTTGGPTTAGTANNTAINVSAENGAGISGLQQYLGGEIIWQID